MYAVAKTTYTEFDIIHGKAKRGALFWNAMPLSARQTFFSIMAEEVGPKYKAALDLAITLEVGKAGSEFAKTIAWDTWAASAAVKRYLSGTFVMDDKGYKYYLNRVDEIGDDSSHIYFYQSDSARGLGICGSTNGFNYPAALAVPDIVASRVGGNGFIGKVPSKAPAFLFLRRMAEREVLDLMAERFESYPWADEALERGVDFRDDLVLRRLKNGFGIICGRQVIETWAKESSTLRIVGSKRAGKVFRKYRREVDPKMEHTILELAGNNPAVIMPSAKNLDGGLEKIVAGLSAGNKSNSGQRCTSPRRWFIHADVYNEVRALAVAEYEKSADNGDGAIDNPLDEKTKIGAIDQGGYFAAMEYLKHAENNGATIIGGKRIFEKRFPQAYYMTPALVIWEGVPAACKEVMHEDEVFAPIANLVKVADLDEAIEMTNKSSENLSGAFYCDNEHITELGTFLRKTDLGSVIHNSPPKDVSPQGVHAGRQDGGVGITGSLKSLDQYMRPKQENDIRLLAQVHSRADAKALAEVFLKTE
jgi:acyl-CoA reductase-like NAD-dependent aldehyde dehydrogenase